jgi:hypothetical protein
MPQRVSNAQFIINYQGQKYNETEEIRHIDFSRYDTIVECFGGSFGFSRFQFYEKGIHRNYIVYDNDNELIDFYNHIRGKVLDNEIDEYLKMYNDYCDIIVKRFTMPNKNKTLSADSLKYVDTEIDDPFMKYWLLKNIKCSFILRVYPKNKINFEIFKYAHFIHSDICDIDFSIYDKKNCLIYLDPPYLFEECNHYKENDSNFFERIVYLFENGFKCLFIHSNTYVIQHIFKKYQNHIYNKTYRNSKKKLEHIVFYSS